ILRASGVTRSGIAAMFLAEAAVLGIVGSALGIAVGYFLAAGASLVMSSIASSVYGLNATPQHAHFHVGLALLSLSLGIAASLSGAWFPSRAAATLDPVLALHNVETRAQETTLGWTRTAIGVLSVLMSSILMAWSPARVGMTLQFAYAALTLLGL